MEMKLFEFLGKEVPGSVSEIRESLDLLAGSIDSAVGQVGIKVTKAFEDKDYDIVSELAKNSKELDEMSQKVQEVIVNLDNIIEEREIKDIDEDLSVQDTPNYNDYIVDSDVEYNLYEDLTYKRPCAFKIEGNKIEAKDWKSTFIKTIDYLAKKDPIKVRSFVDIVKMNGKKVIYFSRVKLPTMRSARKIESADIYVETNLSANGIRNLLIKALNQYNIKLSDYKIYLKADYTELH